MSGVKLLKGDADELAMWVVYSNPRDYPGRFVVRRWMVSAGKEQADPEPAAVVGTLEEARAAVPPGLHRLLRFAEDDPVVLEVWL